MPYQKNDEYGNCLPCTKSEVSYEQAKPMQVVIVDDYKVYCGPRAALNDDAPLTFEIEGSGDDYIDLSDTFLKLKVKITAEDGSPVTHLSDDGETPGEDPTVAPVNNFFHSLFSQVDVSLNDNVVSQSTNAYGYKAYLENLASYSKAVKGTWLGGMEIWEHDEAGKFDNSLNKGHKDRLELFLNGQEVELKGRLHTDLTFQNRLIPNGVTARFTLTRAKPSFCLNAFETDPENYRVVITYANLEVRKVRLVPKQQLEIEQTIAKIGAQIPIIHTVTKNFSIPQGVSTYDIDGLFMGQRPFAITLGLVENASFTGMFSKNPFNFQHFDLNFLCLNVDGKQVPTRPLQPDYENKAFIDCYETMFKGTRMYGDDVSHGLKRYEYPEGYCLYSFNLTPDKSDGQSHVSPRHHGSVRLSVHFAKPLPTTVTLIAVGEFNNVITVDKHRNIVFDYST